jgi:hypothetical protein
MTTLTELADRVERAEGPDRELDWDIAEAVHLTTRNEWGDSVFITRNSGYRPPFFTASLDAAMTLVPEGWAATTVRFSIGTGKAILWRDSWEETHRAIDGISADTPALALTAAALRALAMKEEG